MSEKSKILYSLLANVQPKVYSNIIIIDGGSLDKDEILFLKSYVKDNVVFISDSNFKLQNISAIFRDSKWFFAENIQHIPNLNYDTIVCELFNNNVNVLIKALPNVKNIISLDLRKPGIFSNSKKDNEIDYSDFNNKVCLNEKPKKPFSFYTVNYNTTKFINYLIKSIHKFVKSIDYDIWIFDNSDSEKLILDEDWKDVHIIDNTKGQIISYSKVIQKYSDRKPETYRAYKGYISFKHELAIQYGMLDTRIADNFILCDSDVMIRKDLDFIDTSFAIIGDTEDNNKPTRLCPFLCYINKTKIRQAKISYFDNFRMHGLLAKNGHPNMNYDTGASFFEDCKKKNLKYKKINYNDFCYHFQSGSRIDNYSRARKYNINDIAAELGLEKYKGDVLNIKSVDFSKESNEIYDWVQENYTLDKSNNKYVIYTCVTGNADIFKEKEFYEKDNFDYVYFTDNPNIETDNWKIIDIRPIQKKLKIDDARIFARFIKTHPHLFFKNYKKSIWIDGNIKILSYNLKDEFVSLMNIQDYLIIPGHPCITNVYDELKYIEKLKKEDPRKLDVVKIFLKNEKFNNEGSHVQSNIILRDHNNKKCIELMERWWWMIQNYTKRDQASFSYIMWKFNGKYKIIPWRYIKDNLFVAIGAHYK